MTISRKKKKNLKKSLLQCHFIYSGCKITDSLGNVTVRGEKRWKEQEGSAIVNSLSEHV
jgi:hypothetical protein